MQRLPKNDQHPAEYVALWRSVYKFAIQIPLMAILTQHVERDRIFNERATQVSIKLLRQLVSRDGRMGAVYRHNGPCISRKYFASRRKVFNHRTFIHVIHFTCAGCHFSERKNKNHQRASIHTPLMHREPRATFGAAEAQKPIVSPLLAKAPLTDSILDGSLECARACAAAALRKNYAGHKVRPAARRSNFYQSKVTYRG